MIESDDAGNVHVPGRRQNRTAEVSRDLFLQSVHSACVQWAGDLPGELRKPAARLCEQLKRLLPDTDTVGVPWKWSRSVVEHLCGSRPTQRMSELVARLLYRLRVTPCPTEPGVMLMTGTFPGLRLQRPRPWARFMTPHAVQMARALPALVERLLVGGGEPDRSAAGLEREIARLALFLVAEDALAQPSLPEALLLLRREDFDAPRRLWLSPRPRRVRARGNRLPYAVGPVSAMQLAHCWLIRRRLSQEGWDPQRLAPPSLASGSRLRQLLKTLLAELAPDQAEAHAAPWPGDFKDVVAGARLKWTLRLPPLLRVYRFGELLMRPATADAQLTQDRPDDDQAQARPRSSPPAALDGASEEEVASKSAEPSLHVLLSCLTRRCTLRERHKLADSLAAAFPAPPAGSLPSNVALAAGYVEEQLRNPRVRAQTVRNQLSIHHALEEVLEGAPLLEAPDPEERVDIYAAVLEMYDKPASRRTMRQRLAGLDRYLCRRYGFVSVDWRRPELVTPDEVQPGSIITVDEAAAVLADLFGVQDAEGDLWVAFMLAYFGGLRRHEVAECHCGDVLPGPGRLLFVRRAKTAQGRRLIPLEWLSPPSLLQSFDAHVESRMATGDVLPLVLDSTGSPFEPDRLAARVMHYVRRHIERPVVLHTARRSFASNTLLRIAQLLGYIPRQACDSALGREYFGPASSERFARLFTGLPIEGGLADSQRIRVEMNGLQVLAVLLGHTDAWFTLEIYQSALDTVDGAYWAVIANDPALPARAAQHCLLVGKTRAYDLFPQYPVRASHILEQALRRLR